MPEDNLPLTELSEQENFVSILLRNQHLVQEWVNGPLRIEDFDKNLKLILRMLAEAAEKDITLTKQSFYI
ncbi:MAG: hypothetical protein HC836_46935 [Richelia sp. RM2_1_2]|nr:hypothetical protein [Richelia sp. RM2_1_2]